jgi:hypothetical protein
MGISLPSKEKKSKSISARVSMEYFHEVVNRADSLKLNVNDYIIYCLENHSKSKPATRESIALIHEVKSLKEDNERLLDMMCCIGSSDLGKKWVQEHHPDSPKRKSNTDSIDEEIACALNSLTGMPF